MNYLEKDEPPIRESRIGAQSALGGIFEDVLKNKDRCCCFKSCNRKFSQTFLCQSDFSLPMVNEIKDSVIVKYSPVGCGSMNLYYQSRNEEQTYITTLNTNLDEVDVITGGLDKLEKTIKFADENYKPRYIFVLDSCVPAVMGDDIDGLVNNMQGVINATIVPVHCAGFKTRISASGYDAVYHGLLKFIIGKDLPDKSDIKKSENTVNLINTVSVSQADQDELIRLLEKLGLKVRTLVYGSESSDFIDLLDASLNICICATHDDYLVNYLKELYDIPFLIKNIPLGKNNTSKWLYSIAEFFKKEEVVNRIIAEEEKKLDESLEIYKKRLKGKTAMVNGGEVRVLATAAMLEELGVRVVGIEAKHHDGFAEELIDTFPGNQKKTKYSVGHQPFEKANLVNRLSPDIYIGHNGQCSWPAKQGIPIFTLFFKPYNYFGYNGMINFAKNVDRNLRNTSFYDNLKKHTILPYKKEWYEKDPYSMISE